MLRRQPQHAATTHLLLCPGRQRLHKAHKTQFKTKKSPYSTFQQHQASASHCEASSPALQQQYLRHGETEAHPAFMGFDVLGKWVTIGQKGGRSELFWLGRDAAMATLYTRVNKPGCHPPRDPPGLTVPWRALPLPYPAASSPAAWGGEGSWFCCGTSPGSHCNKLSARNRLALLRSRARLRCQACGAPSPPAPAITELGSGKPRKTLRHLPSLRACTTPLPGDQVGARPCRLSSRCGGNAATAGASPREPGITAGSGAPAGSILLCTSSQSKGSRVPWCDLPRHGQVLSCSAPNQSRGRRFSTSPALHKPKAPQELPLEPPP